MRGRLLSILPPFFFFFSGVMVWGKDFLNQNVRESCTRALLLKRLLMARYGIHSMRFVSIFVYRFSLQIARTSQYNVYYQSFLSNQVKQFYVPVSLARNIGVSILETLGRIFYKLFFMHCPYRHSKTLQWSIITREFLKQKVSDIFRVWFMFRIPAEKLETWIELHLH